MKRLVISASLLTAAISSASAVTPTDWRGGGTFSKVQNCPSSNFANHPSFEGRYHHPDVGDNSPNASFSIFTSLQTFNVTSKAGAFPKTLQPVNGTGIGGGGGTFTSKMKIISLTPGITGTTKTIKLSALIQNFTNASGNESCTVQFDFTGTRCEFTIGNTQPACATH
jgi:hypothetical protein